MTDPKHAASVPHDELYEYVWTSLDELGDVSVEDQCVLVIPPDVDSLRFEKVLAEVKEDRNAQ
jgi:hypothetical protein